MNGGMWKEGREGSYSTESNRKGANIFKKVCRTFKSVREVTWWWMEER